MGRALCIRDGLAHFSVLVRIISEPDEVKVQERWLLEELRCSSGWFLTIVMTFTSCGFSLLAFVVCLVS